MSHQQPEALRTETNPSLSEAISSSRMETSQAGRTTVVCFPNINEQDQKRGPALAFAANNLLTICEFAGKFPKPEKQVLIINLQGISGPWEKYSARANQRSLSGRSDNYSDRIMIFRNLNRRTLIEELIHTLTPGESYKHMPLKSLYEGYVNALSDQIENKINFPDHPRAKMENWFNKRVLPSLPGKILIELARASSRHDTQALNANMETVGAYELLPALFHHLGRQIGADGLKKVIMAAHEITLNEQSQRPIKRAPQRTARVTTQFTSNNIRDLRAILGNSEIEPTEEAISRAISNHPNEINQILAREYYLMLPKTFEGEINQEINASEIARENLIKPLNLFDQALLRTGMSHLDLWGFYNSFWRETAQFALLKTLKRV